MDFALKGICAVWLTMTGIRDGGLSEVTSAPNIREYRPPIPFVTPIGPKV
jgi:hypothetical protein